MSSPPSGHRLALAALHEAGVAFVVVGVMGINFYARRPAEVHATVDLDVLLAPQAENLAAALHALSRQGFVFEASGGPFVDLDDETMLARVVQHGATLAAVREDRVQLDLMTAIAGSSYADLASDATSFGLDGHAIPVARLEKLLRAKRASGRPKDVEFLRAYEARAREDG